MGFHFIDDKKDDEVRRLLEKIEYEKLLKLALYETVTNLLHKVLERARDNHTTTNLPLASITQAINDIASDDVAVRELGKQQCSKQGPARNCTIPNILTTLLVLVREAASRKDAKLGSNPAPYDWISVFLRAIGLAKSYWGISVGRTAIELVLSHIQRHARQAYAHARIPDGLRRCGNDRNSDSHAANNPSFTALEQGIHVTQKHFVPQLVAETWLGETVIRQILTDILNGVRKVCKPDVNTGSNQAQHPQVQLNIALAPTAHLECQMTPAPTPTSQPDPDPDPESQSTPVRTPSHVCGKHASRLFWPSLWALHTPCSP